MMIPHELRQKMLVENHDVPVVRHVGLTELWASSNELTGGMVYGETSQHMCSCPVCQRMIMDNREEKAGVLQPIPITETAW